MNKMRYHIFCLFLRFKSVFEKILFYLFFSLLQINIFLVFLDPFLMH